MTTATARVEHPARARRAARSGSTLIELVVALALAGVIAGAALRLLDHTQRFARGTALVTEERAQLWGASATLRAAIEELSTSGGDLRTATDSSLTWAGMIGHAVACRLAPMGADLPPANLASGIPLTWWAMTPQAGDEVALLDEGTRLGAADDRWFASRVVTVASVPNGCSGTSFVDPVADAGKAGWHVRLADSLPPSVRPGAAVRVFRLQRMSLYRSAGQWMLGWADWNAAAGAWNIIQPLAGPLQPHSAPPGASGLALAWLDSAGAPHPAPAAGPGVASVRLAVRGRTTAALRMDGVARGIRSDSLRTLLTLRNRR